MEESCCLFLFRFYSKCLKTFVNRPFDFLAVFIGNNPSRTDLMSLSNPCVEPSPFLWKARSVLPPSLPMGPCTHLQKPREFPKPPFPLPDAGLLQHTETHLPVHCCNRSRWGLPFVRSGVQPWFRRFGIFPKATPMELTDKNLRDFIHLRPISPSANKSMH